MWERVGASVKLSLAGSTERESINRSTSPRPILDVASLPPALLAPGSWLLLEVAVARPLTHDLLRSIIDSLGASVDYVIVNDLSNDTFFARIMLQIDGRVMEIDSRPSDAIALAVRVQVPIYADESVLEKAGVKLDQEGQTLEAITGETREATTEVSPEELEKLSPFRDVIEGLDLEDFGKKEA